MTQLSLRALDVPVDAIAPPVRPRPANGEAAPGCTLDFELVESFPAFEALEDEWNTLFEEAARPDQVFQGFNWCWHWCRHYLGEAGDGPRLAIVTGRRGGLLVLLLPLVVQRTAGLKELTWLGEPVSQYGDVIAAPDAVHIETLRAAWRFAVARTGADVAHVRRVRADAFATQLLQDLGAAVTATEEAPFLDLASDGSFDQWEARRQPRAKKNRKRQARRLAELGEVEYHSRSGTERAGELVREAVQLKRESLGAKGAISRALADPRFASFFSDAAAGAGGRPAGIVVKSVEVGGATAAIKVLVDNKRARFLHIAVFAPAYEKCGAGALLLENAVRRTIEQECTTLDLLPPRHEYKMDFADGAVVVRDYALAVSAKGWLYMHGFLKVRRKLKAVVEGMPLPVRRAIARLTA